MPGVQARRCWRTAAWRATARTGCCRATARARASRAAASAANAGYGVLLKDGGGMLTDNILSREPPAAPRSVLILRNRPLVPSPPTHSACRLTDAQRLLQRPSFDTSIWIQQPELVETCGG